MDNRFLIEKQSQFFNRDNPTQFLRVSSGKFGPEKSDYSPYLERARSAKDLFVLAMQFRGESSSQNHKQRQYEIAKKDLEAENLNEEGHFMFSWITVQYTTEARRESRNFRRYTWFVLPEQTARTFLEQIAKAGKRDR